MYLGCPRRRCVLQLSALGYLLAPVFAYDSWWLVLLFAAAAVAVASAEAVSHPPAFYRVRQNWHTICREISERVLRGRLAPARVVQGAPGCMHHGEPRLPLDLSRGRLQYTFTA